MDESKIERAAQSLHARIWREHTKFRPQASSLMELLDPSIAAQILGIDLQYVERIGPYRSGPQRFEVAGILDRRAALITVSCAFPPEVRRFTGAHELGHYVLHEQHTFFRDRPVSTTNGSSAKRPQIEAEADYFAACFLMPQDLLTSQAQSTFRVKLPFVFNEASAFHLQPDDPDALLRDDAILDRATALSP